MDSEQGLVQSGLAIGRMGLPTAHRRTGGAARPARCPHRWIATAGCHPFQTGGWLIGPGNPVVRKLLEFRQGGISRYRQLMFHAESLLLHMTSDPCYTESLYELLASFQGRRTRRRYSQRSPEATPIGSTRYSFERENASSATASASFLTSPSNSG